VIPADGDQLFISQKKEQQTMQEQFLFADWTIWSGMQARMLFQWTLTNTGLDIRSLCKFCILCQTSFNPIDSQVATHLDRDHSVIGLRKEKNQKKYRKSQKLTFGYQNSLILVPAIVGCKRKSWAAPFSSKSSPLSERREASRRRTEEDDGSAINPRSHSRSLYTSSYTWNWYIGNLRSWKICMTSRSVWHSPQNVGSGLQCGSPDPTRRGLDPCPARRRRLRKRKNARERARVVVWGRDLRTEAFFWVFLLGLFCVLCFP
jgi:hypothetical protein